MRLSGVESFLVEKRSYWKRLEKLFSRVELWSLLLCCDFYWIREKRWLVVHAGLDKCFVLRGRGFLTKFEDEVLFWRCVFIQYLRTKDHLSIDFWRANLFKRRLVLRNLLDLCVSFLLVNNGVNFRWPFERFVVGRARSGKQLFVYRWGLKFLVWRGVLVGFKGFCILRVLDVLFFGWSVLMCFFWLLESSFVCRLVWEYRKGLLFFLRLFLRVYRRLVSYWAHTLVIR